MADEEEPTYELVMPFVVCKSKGGPYDDDAFVAGCIFGQINAQLGGMRQFGANHLVVYGPPELEAQLDLAAMHHGYTLTAEQWDEDNTGYTFLLDVGNHPEDEETTA